MEKTKGQMKIYSKITGELIHQINRLSSIKSGRVDLSPVNESLQVSTIVMQANDTFKAHRHNYSPRRIPATQESWVVVKGAVTAYYYDLDDSFICAEILHEGDASITYAAAHNYKAVTDAIVYEYKVGTYHGQKVDKTQI